VGACSRTERGYGWAQRLLAGLGLARCGGFFGRFSRDSRPCEQYRGGTAGLRPGSGPAWVLAALQAARDYCSKYTSDHLN